MPRMVPTASWHIALPQSGLGSPPILPVPTPRTRDATSSQEEVRSCGRIAPFQFILHSRLSCFSLGCNLSKDCRNYFCDVHLRLCYSFHLESVAFIIAKAPVLHRSLTRCFTTKLGFAHAFFEHIQKGAVDYTLGEVFDLVLWKRLFSTAQAPLCGYP